MILTHFLSSNLVCNLKKKKSNKQMKDRIEIIFQKTKKEKEKKEP